MAKVIAFFLSIIQFFSIIFSGQSLLPVTDDGETAAMETQERCEERARILANSFYRNYYVKPFNVLVMNDDFTGVATNWEYGALLSLSLSMAQIDESYLEICERVVDGLKYYRHLEEERQFKGYAVGRSTAPNNAGDGVAYNSGSPITGAVELYRVTNDESYLEGIDYAYDNYRSTSKLRYEGTAIPHSWAYGFGKESDDTFVQNVCTNAEIYARLALYAD